MAESKKQRIGRLIKSMTYDETYDIAREIVGMIKGRIEDEIEFKADCIENWMEFLQSWASGAVESDD
jgi:hypothetical protein